MLQEDVNEQWVARLHQMMMGSSFVMHNERGYPVDKVAEAVELVLAVGEPVNIVKVMALHQEQVKEKYFQCYFELCWDELSELVLYDILGRMMSNEVVECLNYKSTVHSIDLQG